MKKQIFFTIPLILLIVHCSYAQPAAENIRLNQLGFYSRAPKLAVVTSVTNGAGGTVPITARDFFITTPDSRDTVFKGALSEMRQSKNSSLTTRIAEFTALQQPGTYIVCIAGGSRSYPFKIADAIHHSVAVAALKGFYYIRASMPLEEKYAGQWARAAGHPDTAVFIHPSAASKERPTGTKISFPGGWYDAGDYNKYIVNSGITMGTLLSAYEDFTAYYDTLHTNIPESGSGLPDILNEALYNLRWMLTMQDPNDGGVYHKCTNAAFDGMVMPDVTKAPRYVVQKGTAATLDFAAVMAQASRILTHFKKQLPGLSDSCLNGALKAWRWAGKNPSLVYDQDALNKTFEPKITTGAYGDNHFDDEWFWAAAELFATTKDKKFYKMAEKGIGTTSRKIGTTDKEIDSTDKRIDQPFALPSWANVRTLGFYTLVRNERLLPSYAAGKIAEKKKQLIAFADSYILPVAGNAFQTVMGGSREDFNWGSNSNAANQGILLINAYLISKDKKYIGYALSNLDYLLGRNATGYCFVTGIGTKSTMHPHHRPSVADGIAEPVPGLMAGGPNPGMQDHCHYDFTEPETAYADIDCAYASNEIAINWNAPLVYLANAIEALQFEIAYSVK